MAAITEAAEKHDRAAIPNLIEMLDSDDPVVRLAAIRALEQLTGQTLGYDYADPEWKRKDAANAWQRWYQSQGGRADQDPSTDRESVPRGRIRPGSGSAPRQRFGYTPLGPIQGTWG